MKRREFITLLGGAAAVAAGGARAAAGDAGDRVSQQRLVQRTGELLAAFRRGLREIGYVEGQNVAIEYRWADDQYDRLPALAAELVRRQVSVIAATGTSAPGLAARAATSVIPIVFQTGATDQGRSGYQHEPAVRQCHRNEYFLTSLEGKRFICCTRWCQGQQRLPLC